MADSLENVDEIILEKESEGMEERFYLRYSRRSPPAYGHLFISDSFLSPDYNTDPL